MNTIREKLEVVQQALRHETRRCRQLVAEYTRRLQEKEQQYHSEKVLRDNQLAKVLRSLLIFEARLKQEQRYISHQLSDKEVIIKRQREHIHKLSVNQHCKHCNHYFNSIPPDLESGDNSSEYVATECQDYQSSNFESLGSSTETYATISEKEYDVKMVEHQPEVSRSSSDVIRNSENTKIFQKNKQTNSLTRRPKKYVHKKNANGTVKLRSECISPASNDDNTSNDFEQLESLPPESITSEKIDVISERIENIFTKCTNTNLTEVNLDKHDKECNVKTLPVLEGNQGSVVEHKHPNNETVKHEVYESSVDVNNKKSSKISDCIPVFDQGGESNDNWYASASDQEDDDHCDLYRNNPVLECMNQILLQNINDPIQTPPKSPSIDRKSNKSSKKVKFSDENQDIEAKLKSLDGQVETCEDMQSNYYETPVQKQLNFYETPQSIYSNDYEQILSKCGDSVYKAHSPTKLDNAKEKETNKLTLKRFAITQNIEFEDEPQENHYYIDMDSKLIREDPNMVRKSKILRTPPALPPKPANLMSKYKIQLSPTKAPSTKQPIFDSNIDSEPDYCSISELNLPKKKANVTKLNVVAEINTRNVKEDNMVAEKHIILHSPKQNNFNCHYDPIIVKDKKPGAGISKSLDLHLTKTPGPSKLETTPISPTKGKSKIETEIPKLPQVSEILIPDDDETTSQECISQDNYIKNNSQILKHKNTPTKDSTRRPIVLGSSVSSIISGFNNHQVLSEIRHKSETKITQAQPPQKLSSFDCLQNFDKQQFSPSKPENVVSNPSPDFDKFDLNQNFEEFKLDDCEIGEDYTPKLSKNFDCHVDVTETEEHIIPDLIPLEKVSTTRVELVRATNENVNVPLLNMTNVQQFRTAVELQNMNAANEKDAQRNEPNYEHFLECTGLSSKSILTPSRLLSNHKSMLKPKDVKLRSKAKHQNVLDRQGNSVKYRSEPFV